MCISCYIVSSYCYALAHHQYLRHHPTVAIDGLISTDMFACDVVSYQNSLVSCFCYRNRPDMEDSLSVLRVSSGECQST